MAKRENSPTLYIFVKEYIMKLIICFFANIKEMNICVKSF